MSQKRSKKSADEDATSMALSGNPDDYYFTTKDGRKSYYTKWSDAYLRDHGVLKKAYGDDFIRKIREQDGSVTKAKFKNALLASRTKARALLKETQIKIDEITVQLESYKDVDHVKILSEYNQKRMQAAATLDADADAEAEAEGDDSHPPPAKPAKPATVSSKPAVPKIKRPSAPAGENVVSFITEFRARYNKERSGKPVIRNEDMSNYRTLLKRHDISTRTDLEGWLTQTNMSHEDCEDVLLACKKVNYI